MKTWSTEGNNVLDSNGMKNTETQRHKGTKARIQCFFTARLCTFVSLCLCVFPYSFGFVPNMFGAASTAPRVADCDRECLRGFITQYLNALLLPHPPPLPLLSQSHSPDHTT